MSDSERRTVVDWARSYIEAKLHPVPIKRGSKKPDGGDGWNAKTYMPEDFEPDGNIGLMHDNQAALDFDFVHDQDGRKDVPDEDRYERSRELVELLLGEQAIISQSLKGLHAY